MHNLLPLLRAHYSLPLDSIEFVRESVSTAYIARAGGEKCFLRCVKPAFIEDARRGIAIQVYLQQRGFPVPPVIFTNDGAPCVEDNGRLLILYEYVEGHEADPARDAEALGALTGQLHLAMQDYPGQLIRRDKHYYIDKYVVALRERQYPCADEFAALGETLWHKVKDLPRGFCHGDMYRGNFLKTSGGKLYVLDFDTACEGFPLYDPALLCNRTDYFRFRRGGYACTLHTFGRFLPAYLRYSPISQTEITALPDMIAVYHFALQATIMELHGPGCVDDKFLDSQLAWLTRWQSQCEKRRI